VAGVYLRQLVAAPLWRLRPDEVGPLLFIVSVPLPSFQFGQRSESTQRVLQTPCGPRVHTSRPGAELAAYGQFSHDPPMRTDNFDPPEESAANGSGIS